MIEYWLVGPGALPPERHQGAALDLRARLPQRGWRLVWGFARIPTGVALRIPADEVVRVTGRSSSFLRGIIVHDGLIESEFNAQEVCVLAYCPGPRTTRRAQRTGQMWAIPVDPGASRALEEAPQALPPGKAGFGPTGR